MYRSVCAYTCLKENKNWNLMTLVAGLLMKKRREKKTLDVK